LNGIDDKNFVPGCRSQALSFDQIVEEKNMRYMLMIYHDEKLWDGLTEPERQQNYSEYRQLREDLTASGKFLTGDQLQPASAANTVRVRDAQPLITDGPFAETREQLGGFFLIEADDLAEANAIAARIPSARDGSIEVRPVVERSQPASA
jgi:hypothetical protein